MQPPQIAFNPAVIGKRFQYMHKLVIPGIVVLLATSLSAQVGQPMPPLEIDAAYNFDSFKLKRLDQLAGKVVFVEYWQTW